MQIEESLRRILQPASKLGRVTLSLGVLSILSIVLRWGSGAGPGSKLSSWTTFVTGVFAVCAAWLIFSWARRMLHPISKLGRATLWLGGLSGLFIVLSWVSGSGSESSFSDWAVFLSCAFGFCGALLLGRWVQWRLLWRLRNRLIVTYIFIGVIPIVLLLLMAALGGYLFAGQFSAYIAISNLQSTLHNLEAANDVLAAQMSALDRSGKLNEQIAGQLTSVSGENFPNRTVTVWQGEKAYVLSAAGVVVDAHPAGVPDAIKGNFGDFVIDGNSPQLRVLKRQAAGAHRLVIMSNIPITSDLLQSASSRLGAVTLVTPDVDEDLEVPPRAKGKPNRGERVEAGSVPAPANRFDPTLRFYTLFNLIDWASGKSQTGDIGVVTRLSVLYSALFATLGDNTQFLKYGLTAIAIIFGLIELVALYIGIRLSRSMTRSVAELYRATEYVERGDLTRRILVPRRRDQMAALEHSFNSMTDSLAKLIDEQKQKQRLESELSIGHEVQNSLFPPNFTDLAALEIYGICRPARSVSGDYYDFISLGAGRLVLALGDISGKGISAALLMATVHAFVRAYTLEPDAVSTPAVVGPFSSGDSRMYYRGGGVTQSQLDPGMLMTTLNYQLFRSTPREKYATMFLACYDAARRELKYCNAGHLSPIVLQGDGGVLRLEPGGTVVGLFDGATYEESTISMQPGDIFVAFTDGVTEPENASGEFGDERLVELIKQYRDQPLSDIGDRITGAVADWIGSAEQPDDVTVVLARAH